MKKKHNVVVNGRPDTQVDIKAVIVLVREGNIRKPEQVLQIMAANSNS